MNFLIKINKLKSEISNSQPPIFYKRFQLHHLNPSLWKFKFHSRTRVLLLATICPRDVSNIRMQMTTTLSSLPERKDCRHSQRTIDLSCKSSATVIPEEIRPKMDERGSQIAGRFAIASRAPKTN